MRLAVISDVHGNAGALAAALFLSDRAGYDTRVLLGDLLTYGVDVARTLDLAAEAMSRPGNVLLRGNHDQIYDRFLDGEPIPDGNWVGRHMRWTAARLPAAIWRGLPFRDELIFDDVLFTHANPFGRHDWTYLNSADDHARAAAAIADRGLRCAVVGHTHRAKVFVAGQPEGGFLKPGSAWQTLPPGAAVVNAGSIGQPRSHSPREVVLWLDTGGSSPAIAFEPVRYDVAAHLRGIRESDLPDDVIARCLAYHPTA